MTAPAPATAPTWDPAWVAAHSQPLQMDGAWRGVETQYMAASMQLVDTLQEQDVLEQLLEQSKPPARLAQSDKHYLLLSPFRYFPQHSSRFRPQGRSGLWYGASSLEGACSEIAYWRMRFILDSASLCNQGAVMSQHTLYQARVQGHAIDLMAAPWVDFAQLWKHPSDYGATQQLAAVAAQAQVQWIRYESVRAPAGCPLAAVLTPDALFASAQEIAQSTQEWICKATHETVLMRRQGGAEQFEFHR